MAIQDAQQAVGGVGPGGDLIFQRSGVAVRRSSQWGDAWRRLLKNKLAVIGGSTVLALLLIAVFADELARFSFARQHLFAIYASPSHTYWFGTDKLGRDLYSRIIYGARVSMAVGCISMLFATIIGVTVGAISGFYAGRTDNFIMRVVDVWYSIPTLFFAILVMEALGKSVSHLIIAIALTSWPLMARLTRAQVLSLREKEYIKAARLSGGRSWQIIIRHLIPNSLTPIIVAITFGIPTAIFTEATLSFFGIGVNPPIPSWGQMVGDSTQFAQSYWFLAFFPTTALAITMLGFTFLGDGLRDALDPRMNN